MPLADIVELPPEQFRAEVIPHEGRVDTCSLRLFLGDAELTIYAGASPEIAISRNQVGSCLPLLIYSAELADELIAALEAVTGALKLAHRPRAEHSTLDDEAWLQGESVRS